MTSPVVEINSLVGEMTSTVGKINSTSVTRRNRFLVVIKQPVPPLKKVQARAVALAVTVCHDSVNSKGLFIVRTRLPPRVCSLSPKSSKYKDVHRPRGVTV